MDEPIRVLHVDDGPDFAEMVAEFLTRQDERFDVETVTNPSKALDRLSKTGFDCIVSDFDMPGQDGIEFLKDVREDYPDLPFILYTGKGSEEVASDAISAGVTDYLQKQPGQEQYQYQLLANKIIIATDRYRSKTNYREIFEKIPEGIVIHDADDGSFVDMNRRYAEMFGYRAKEELLDAGFDTDYCNCLPVVRRDGPANHR